MKLPLFLILILSLTSCTFRVYTGRTPVEYNNVQREEIVFTENKVNARVKWKKEIATPFFSFQKKVYFLGSNTALLPDGRLYYHDQVNLFALDSLTGEVISRYEKPVGTQSQVIDLENAEIEEEKKIFPLVDFMGEQSGFLVIDKTGHSEVEHNEGGRLYNNGEIIGILGDGIDYIISAHQFGVKKPDLRVRKWFIDPHAISVSDKRLIILYSKKENIHIESYDLNTGTLIWQNEFAAIKPPDNSFYETVHVKELKVLHKLKELFVVEIFKLDKNTGELSERVTSLSPDTGNVNWQMTDATRVFVKRATNNDSLFYLSKKDQPNIVYGIEEKSGEEKKKLALTDYQYMQGLISSTDKIFFPTQKDSKKRPIYYDGFTSLKKDTGEIDWSITLDEQLMSLPTYKDDILYFGNANDFNRTLKAGSRKEYEYNLYSVAKEDFQDFLHKTALAVDAKTGKILWKMKLDGGDESYIEKIMVKDNMAFVKSVSGWLYAIEFEKASGDKADKGSEADKEADKGR